MAAPPITRQVLPSESTPDTYQSRAPNQDLSVNPAMFGYEGYAALANLGQGMLSASAFFSQVKADDASNQYQEFVNKQMYGDPSVKGPDGQPDIGYMGLKGRGALDAREATMKRIEDFRGQLRSKMSPYEQAQFDQVSRRFKNITDAEISRHATTQATAYSNNVNQATINNNLNMIGSAPDDNAVYSEATGNIVAARVKQAQLLGGGPELEKQAMDRGMQEALEARLTGIATRDPARALTMLERERKVAGARYDELYGKFRARADQQVGRETADKILMTRPLEDGADTLSVIRHFEDFRTEAYWDVNHHRVGYGSDTVTRADGKVEKTTRESTVTREDAERDLARRATIYQNDVRKAIGDDAWSKLDARAKASLTSVAYNYGTLPDSVAKAAREGDKEAIAAAIEGLAGHNGGVNAARRRMEAANVRGQSGIPVSQVEATQIAMNDPALADRPEAQAAAVARINQSYARMHTEQIRSRVAFDTRVKDSEAEALTQGQTSQPIAEQEFTRQYGPENGRARYAEYVSNVQYGADYKAMQTMSEVEQQQLIDARTDGLRPGTLGYSHDVRNVERLQKGMEKLQEQRRTDPAGSVSRETAVAEAYKLVDPRKPETFRLVARARLEAQERLGIDPENQSPITKAEAMKLTEPLRNMIPGTEERVYREVGSRFLSLLGDDADRALAYAFRVRRFSAEQAQRAAMVTKSIAEGLRFGEQEALTFDQDAELSAAHRAVQDAWSRANPSPERMARESLGLMPTAPAGAGPGQRPFPGMRQPNDRAASVEGSPVIERKNPSPADIRYLLANPGSAAQFDREYGVGRAAEITKAFPVQQKAP